MGSDGEEEQRSVSSLASRFEQLASSSSASNKPYPSSKNSSTSSLNASAPPSSGAPAPPVKRPKPVTSRSFPLQEQAARLEALVGAQKNHAISEASSPTEATFKSSISATRPTLPPVPPRAVVQQQEYSESAAPSSGHSMTDKTVQEPQPSSKSLAPPPIPHATRPSPPSTSTPSFAYNLSPPHSTSDASAPQSHIPHRVPSSPNRSRTPPPIPAPRRSRPNTPSASYVEAPSPTSSMAVELERPTPTHPHGMHGVTSAVAGGVTSGVNAIAAKFGHAKPSKSYTSSCSPSSSQRTSPDIKHPPIQHSHPFDPHSASRALQNAISENVPIPSSSQTSSSLHSSHASPLKPLSALDSGSRSPARTNTPPPVVPRRSQSKLEAPDNSEQIGKSAPVTTRTSPLPPALPSRDRSNSLRQNGDPFAEQSTSLIPPLPSRSLPDTGRPRSATAVEARSLNHRGEIPKHPRGMTIPVSGSGHSSSDDVYIPPPPPVRSVQNGEVRSTTSTMSDQVLGTHGHRFARNAADGSLDSSSADEDDDAGDDKKSFSEMPDASFANRRPPTINPGRKLYPKHSVYAFALHGRYAISVTTHLRIWDTWSGETTGIITLQGEHKVVAVEFVFTDSERGKDGRIAWAGTKDGKLFEVDIQTMQVLETKSSAHSTAISVIYRASGNRMITVCESGKVQIWSNDADPDASPHLSSTPRTQRLGDKHSYVKCFENQLWSCHGPLRQSTISSHLSSSAARSPMIRVYEIGPQGAVSLTSRAMHTLDNGCPVGSVMAGTVIPSEPNLVYLAHETGHISIWDRTALGCLNVVRVSPYAITALEGVNGLLWAGNREGSIHVYDTKHTPWKVVKAWKAADEPICGLQVDLATLATHDMLHVASYGRENLIMWDGLLEVDWLEHAMLKREAEFSTYRDVKVFILSWNIDSSKPADLQSDADSVNFLSDALHSSLHGSGYGEEPPEVIVFGLQEVVDLEDKKLTAKNMLLGRKKADAMFQDQVSHQYMRWHDRLVQAVRTAMPADSPYYLLHAENLVGLQTLLFVRTSEKPNVSDAAKVSVKTGMGGRYGNKGAILARFVIDDSSLCFLNCHLAAGQRATRQRNKDLINILENKAAFLIPSSAVPGIYIGGDGETVYEHEICFLSGDLNYRISLTRSIVSANIRSNNMKLLLDHDQLAKEMKTNQAFRLRSFREADINFMPTYKFDPGTNNYDSSAKERIPAWCDRILYRVQEPSLKTEKIKPLEYRSWPATPSDHKPISGLYSVRIKKMDRDRRAEILHEVEQAWSARARDILVDAKRFHGLV